jgi:hypothetical protein
MKDLSNIRNNWPWDGRGAQDTKFKFLSRTPLTALQPFFFFFEIIFLYYINANSNVIYLPLSQLAM